MIVGEMKVVVDCYWRSTKKVDTAQLFNLTADPSELTDLAKTQPKDVQRIEARLAHWEAQSVEPYNMHLDKSCGEGKPQGSPPHWDSWC